MANALSAYSFTVAIHQRESYHGWSDRGGPAEGNKPRQMSHIGRLQEKPMVGHGYNY